MGLLFLEGFETFGVHGATGEALQDELRQKWTYFDAATSMSLSNAAYNAEGLCLNHVSGSSNNRMIASTTPSNELIVGFAWYTGSSITQGYLYSGRGSSAVMQLYVLSTGAIRIYDGAGNQETSAGTVVTDTWYYVEFKYKVDDNPNGYWEFYLDGALVDSKSGDTWWSGSSKELDGHWFQAQSAGTKFDDIYIYDNTGDVQEPFGPVKVKALFPDGDDTTDWTSTGGNHYDQVNDIPVNTATYVESDVASDDDLFTFANASDPATAPIYGVQLNLYAAVTDVGVFTLDGVAESNATQETANETLIDTEGGQYNFVFETDPDTASAWTVDQLNAAIFGVRVG
jgi:hypothetical protein